MVLSCGKTAAWQLLANLVSYCANLWGIVQDKYDIHSIGTFHYSPVRKTVVGWMGSALEI